MLRENPEIKALISRSTTATFLRKEFGLPVVDLNLTDFDFAKTISELPDKEDLLRSLFGELPPDPKEEIDYSDANGSAHRHASKEGYLVSGTLEETEEQIIREAYRRCCGNIGTLTEVLGIGRTTLWRKMKQYGLRNSP